MAEQTTTKVAAQTGAAKDDLLLASATGLTEDNVSANLNVLANDPGAARLYSLAQNVSGYTATTQFPVTTRVTLASGAVIQINGDGSIGYDAGGVRDLQSYAKGEFFTDTFVYTVRMGNGALSTAKATITVAGANDAPTLASVEPVSILDTENDDNPEAITGTLNGADVDHGAVLTYSLADGSLEGIDEYGKLTLDAQTGAYRFVADPDKIDALAAGVNATASFTVKVTDEHGAASTPVTLTFELKGANDTASISGTTTGAVSEDDASPVGGTVTVSDRDAGQSVFQTPQTLAGAYGNFTVDTATGEWTYTLRNGDANVQALNGGKAVADEIVVKSFDDTATATLHVDVTGVNDEASIDGDKTGWVTEDSVTSVSGKLNMHDVDAGEAGFLAPESLVGQYGQFFFDTDTGGWTYELNNISDAVQALMGGQTRYDDLVVTSLDGSASETIHVAVAGADEAPVIIIDPEPNPVTSYDVSYGNGQGHKQATFDHFDSNDILTSSGNLAYKSFHQEDWGNNGTMDTIVTFDFFNGNGTLKGTVDAILIGYTGFTEAQLG
jgi:VCBS repeat-containing protein